MKTIVNILLAVILILSLTVSCEKDVLNIKPPEFDLKLLISGFLSPDEINHYISVKTNGPIYYDTTVSWNPGHISATLSDGSKEISLRPLFHKFYKYAVNDSTTFISDFPDSSYNIPGVPDSSFIGFIFTSSELPVEDGKTYVLKVESDKGLYAEASCTVPYRRNLFPTLDTVRFFPYENSNLPYLQTKFSFTDIAGEENYYAILSELTSYHSYDSTIHITNGDLVDRKYSFLDDKKMDGKKTTIPLGNIPANGFTYYDSTFLKIFILTTDKPYYDYHKSIGNYQSGETPFTEASPIYSNIKGGLGIFAAYTYDSIIVRLK